MNYERQYSLLIEKARSRVLDGYVERHHIIPKCIGGSDDISNLIQLTPEEHYVAHQLLHKIHSDSVGLAYAMVMLCANRYGMSHNKAYGWVKRKVSIARSSAPPRAFSDKAKENMSQARIELWKKRKELGVSSDIAKKIVSTRKKNGSYIFTEEHKANISKGCIGRETSLQARENISKALKGKSKTAEHIKAVADANRGQKRKPLSDEHKQKLREINTGRTFSDESKEKMSRAQKGIIPSKATRELWSKQRTGKAHTEDQKVKISEGLKKAYANGRKGAMCKLSDSQVREIRVLISEKTLLQKEIALKFNVSGSVITDLKNGKSYSNVI